MITDNILNNQNDYTKTIYRRIRVTNNLTKGTYFGYIKEEEIHHKHPLGGYWLQTQHLNQTRLQNYVFSDEFLTEAPNLKRSIERFGKENFTVTLYETDTFSSIDEVEEAITLLIERFQEHYMYPVYNDEFMTEEDEIDWKTLKENAHHLKVEEETNRKKLPNHRPVESITIQNFETGEEKTFENKTDCMNFLNTSSATFSKFLKGQSKLNKLFKVKEL